MKHIEANQLNIAYLDIGSSDGKPVFLMHGFPYDVHSYDVVSERLSDQGFRCIIPFLRGYGPTSFKSSDNLRSGQQAALGADLLSLMDALDVPEAILGGYDWGGRAACIVAALWPERVYGLVSCGAGYNIQNIAEAGNPVPPAEEYRYWYQYYFRTERGRAGLSLNRRELSKLIWRLWSPTWKFDEATFDQTAIAFDNPDFVEIVIHSYRHRFGGVPGDPVFDEIEAQLATQPNITVPSIVLLGGDDGVDPPMSIDDDMPHFTGPYERLIVPGAGHNLPQEMPDAFVDAVVKLS
jgi:pimeloyl-ACP methyl ester carboxylesterase